MSAQGKTNLTKRNAEPGENGAPKFVLPFLYLNGNLHAHIYIMREHEDKVCLTVNICYAANISV